MRGKNLRKMVGRKIAGRHCGAQSSSQRTGLAQRGHGELLLTPSFLSSTPEHSLVDFLIQYFDGYWRLAARWVGQTVRVDIEMPVGGRRSLRVSTAALKDADGTLGGAEVTFSDVTEMERVKFVMKGGVVVKNDLTSRPPSTAAQ